MNLYSTIRQNTLTLTFKNVSTYRTTALGTRYMSLEHNYNSSSELPLPPSMQKKTAQETQPIKNELFSDETRTRLERLRQHRFHPSNIPDSPDFGTNQYMNINEELKQQLKDVVSQFNAPVRYAVAYGSGVFHQSGYDEKVNNKYINTASHVNKCIEKTNGRFHLWC